MLPSSQKPTMASFYCEEYPVTQYTVVIENLLNPSETRSFSLPADEFPVAITRSLPGDSVYQFKVTAINDVGEVSTDYQELCESECL